MRKLLQLALFLGFGSACFAQTGSPVFQFVAAPPSGSCSQDAPIQIVYSTGQFYSCNNGTWNGGSAGSGNVSSVNAGNLSPLFITTVSNPTTNAALGFALSNAAQNSFFAGPSTGGAGSPLYRAIVAADVPTLNQSTTGNAATATALAAAPTRCGSGNAPTGVDINGNAVTCQAIAGGGGGATLQTNTVNNSSQTTLNFTDNSQIKWSNPSGGVESATLAPTGASTIVGFNASNVFTAFTAGTGISFAGGQISTSGSSGITGSLTTNCIPVATGTGTLGCSTATDNGSVFSITNTGGLQLNASTPAAFSLVAGAGSIPSLSANSFGFAAPVTGGTSYLFKPPATWTQGYLFGATTATGDGVLESSLTPQSTEFALTTAGQGFGGYNVNTVLLSTKANNAGHFTNLQTVTTGGGCTTPPFINVFDGTTSAGTPLQASSSAQTKGQSTNGAQTLTFAAGDIIGIYVSTAGASCATYINVSAEVSVP